MRIGVFGLRLFRRTIAPCQASGTRDRQKQTAWLALQRGESVMAVERNRRVILGVNEECKHGGRRLPCTFGCVREKHATDAALAKTNVHTELAKTNVHTEAADQTRG